MNETEIKFHIHKGFKCPRCYRYHYNDLNFGHETVTEENKNEKLCNRCVAIILKYYPSAVCVPFILDNLKNRNLQPEENPEWNNV